MHPTGAAGEEYAAVALHFAVDTVGQRLARVDVFRACDDVPPLTAAADRAVEVALGAPGMKLLLLPTGHEFLAASAHVRVAPVGEAFAEGAGGRAGSRGGCEWIEKLSRRST